MVKNTFRFLVAEERRKEVDLKYLVEKVLFGKCGVVQTEIFCIQDFQASGKYDVTFYAEEVCFRFFQDVCKVLRDPVLNGITVKPLLFEHEKRMTVHLFDPYTDMDLVVAFLRQFCREIIFEKRLCNEFGIYNGKSVLNVKLKIIAGHGGLCHPPGSFNIAGHRGFLSYAGQPRFCKNCYQFGHSQNECVNENVCRRCGQAGHAANSCSHPKCCDVCGAGDHMVKQCPVYMNERKKSSGEAGGGKPEGSGPRKGKAGDKVPEEVERDMQTEGRFGGKKDGDKQMPEKKDPVVKKGEEEEEMETQAAAPSKEERKRAASWAKQEFVKGTKPGRKTKVVKEHFFHDKCTFAKLRAMGFAKLKNSDCLVIPEGFIVPEEWTGFESFCTFVEIT